MCRVFIVLKGAALANWGRRPHPQCAESPRIGSKFFPGLEPNGISSAKPKRSRCFSMASRSKKNTLVSSKTPRYRPSGENLSPVQRSMTGRVSLASQRHRRLGVAGFWRNRSHRRRFCRGREIDRLRMVGRRLAGETLRAFPGRGVPQTDLRSGAGHELATISARREVHKTDPLGGVGDWLPILCAPDGKPVAPLVRCR